MDAKNGFLTKFHMDMVVQKKSQLFFFVKKNIFWKWNWNKKVFWKIFLLIFKKYFFFRRKKKLRKKLDYHFDVEFCQESIFGIHKCNGAVLKVQNNVWTILKYLTFFMIWKFSLVVYSIFPIAFEHQNTTTPRRACSAPQNLFPIDNRVSKQFKHLCVRCFAVGTPLMPKIISGSSHLQNLTHVSTNF